MRMDEIADGISRVRGSPLSRETPRGSSFTKRGKTPSEVQIWVTLQLASSPNVIANTASNPPAPGTPARRTPSIFIVASRSRVCDSGSICVRIERKFSDRVLKPSGEEKIYRMWE